MIERFLAWRRERRDRCRVDVEWGGLFIGRSHCRTHGYRWDPPGEMPCPGHTRPTVGLREGTWTS